ncbi:DUF3040 domain-containing protein [Rhodococcus triatomae]|uniref:DUF3040 domain-containing protein n=1 Tax=Rhodococcus triatomae TaxID=300028 RepID=A0A1G8D2W2_9NOCA|nr:DUF3040 domain-containing protein [Rhodococcus triatomae]QNG18523.1 DUF3040 domain-containing protein [Rhodococcus triatomae]QNG21808.1 DUF3040 domain-containing protein [Rhodococcus triatomae]SDH52032.1 Protein of unknown function [Rhodococcus triatomae]
MPLSEHEQRMLDQIESALYAEDPKFASSVRGGRLRATSSRRRLQAVALFVLGLVLLIAGVALPIRLGGFPILSLFGFIVMFGAGVLLLWGGSGSKAEAEEDPADPSPSGGKPRGRSSGGRGGGAGRNKGGGFSSRMEDRFRKRFEQE